MPSQLPHTLREYLQQKDQDLAAVANNLWRISRPIHERQNRPDSNENGIALRGVVLQQNKIRPATYLLALADGTNAPDYIIAHPKKQKSG